MDSRIEKYLNDIIDSIEEIDDASIRFGKSFIVFENDVVFRKFVERNLEIIGEAMNRILKIDPSISITAARKVVDTRNYVIHAYDSLKADILWAIVINHLPILRNEVKQLIGTSNKGL